MGAPSKPSLTGNPRIPASCPGSWSWRGHTGVCSRGWDPRGGSTHFSWPRGEEASAGGLRGGHRSTPRAPLLIFCLHPRGVLMRGKHFLKTAIAARCVCCVLQPSVLPAASHGRTEPPATSLAGEGRQHLPAVAHGQSWEQPYVPMLPQCPLRLRFLRVFVLSGQKWVKTAKRADLGVPGHKGDVRVALCCRREQGCRQSGRDLMDLGLQLPRVGPASCLGGDSRK